MILFLSHPLQGLSPQYLGLQPRQLLFLQILLASPNVGFTCAVIHVQYPSTHRFLQESSISMVMQHVSPAIRPTAIRTMMRFQIVYSVIERDMVPKRCIVIYLMNMRCQH